ncbi:MAG: MopE-related protein [Myxococcota bacterium]|nr:MopE-related protein [Myxococcota bacterium]
MQYNILLRNRLFIAMGLSTLSLSTLTSCQNTEEKDTAAVAHPEDVDDDGDGMTENEGDCNDEDATVYVGAEEIANDGIDQDCDGEDRIDIDGDGYDANIDCDDTNASIHPAAEEICDEVDNNCDGIIDDDAVDRQEWYPDADQDSFGDPNGGILACTQPEGLVEDGSDCDDNNADVFPDASEVCNNIDDDCNAIIDDNASDTVTWYQDADNDGFGNIDATLQACEQPEGYTSDNADCDDNNNNINPLAEEEEDGLDNNCNGTIDEIECFPAPLITDAMTLQNNMGNPGPYTFCAPLPADGSPCADLSTQDPTQFIYDTIGPPPDSFCIWMSYGDVCGPDATTPNECCYTMNVDISCIAVGRPFTVDGEMRTAAINHSDHWIRPFNVEILSLSEERRGLLGSMWIQAAQEEHASIASFARFTMQLLSMGAPPDLVAAATRAQADEIAHARTCYSIASQILGVDIGPDPLNIDGALAKGNSPREILISTLIEGCVNETFAAAEAGWLSEQCQVPSIQKSLCKIANDEGSHSALAWKTVKWILSKHSDLIDIAQQTMRQIESKRLSSPPQKEHSWLKMYGIASSKDRFDLQESVWKQVIHPCFISLCDSFQRQESLPA